MAQFMLRKVSRAKWDRAGREWLGAADILGDVVADLRTQDGKLSVFLCTADQAQIQPILTALGANGDYLANVDYALVPLARLQQLGFTWEKSEGDTPMTAVNDLHYDLSAITLSRLHDLARVIQFECERKRARKREVSDWVLAEIKGGTIDPSQLREAMQSELAGGG